MLLRKIIASLILLSAPYWALYAQAAAGGAIPEWAERIDGFRLADVALSEIRTTGDAEQGSLVVSETTVAKAKAAYSAEPLATDALFITSLALDEKRPAILAAARTIDKRNRLIGLSLLELEAQRFGTEEVLSLLDELVRVQPKLAPQFVSVLSTSLTDERSLPLLEQALASHPAWANAFWRKVPTDTAALTRFLQLREKISPPSDAASEKSLLQALVNSERFAEAYNLYVKLSSQPGIATTYPPFDWRPGQTRDIRVREISPTEFDLFIQRDTSGVLLEKLVPLSAGEFVLLGELVNRQGEGDFHAELRCVGKRSEQNWSSRVSYPNARWSIPDGSCRFARLTLSGSAWDSLLPFEGGVRGLKFERREKINR